MIVFLLAGEAFASLEDEMALLRAAVIVLSCLMVWSPAQADIYAWQNESGGLTLSDHAPPPGVRVIDVVSEPAAKRPTASNRARNDGQAQLDYLTERVRELEGQVRASQPPAPAPVVQYAPTSSGYPYGCYYWADCGPWWSTPFYPPVFGVVAFPPFGFQRFHGFHRFRGGHSFAHGSGTLHHR